MPAVRSSQEELSWWAEHMQEWNGKSLIHREQDISIKSDASQKWVGDHCAWEPVPGPVVKEGEGVTYKLLGTASSIHSSQEIPGVLKEHLHSPVNKQSYSNRVCKQHGRNCLHPGNIDSRGALNVVPSERHIAVNSAPYRQRQHDSRLGVERNEGPHINGPTRLAIDMPSLHNEQVKLVIKVQSTK